MHRSLPIALLLLTTSLSAQNWPQWAASAQHDSATSVIARRIDRIEQEIVIDPFAETIEALSGAGELLAHYPVPMIDGEDVVLLLKSGSLSNLVQRETQIWNVVDMRRVNGQLTTHWMYGSDWKPVPFGNPSWEPVYHPAISADAVWAPGAGGTIDKLNRETGVRIQRFNPFTSFDPTIFVSGPPAIDQAGNIYYNAIQLTTIAPWNIDPPSSWLVRIGADGTITKATFTSLTPNAPAANDPCLGVFDASSDLPWPPAPTAAPPSFRCGPQRPGINVAPAVGADGTIYTVSRAHFNSRFGFLVAVKPDLTPKWAASMRNRFQDGCDVALPPSGSAGGCRQGATRGVDPADNQPGSGAVNDNSTASPVVLPDGNILYGAYTRYNYSQGHLMMFSGDGQYLRAYGWGWDLTPAVYRHHGTYSIILKENHYSAGSYCGDPNICPLDRSSTTPLDPEVYYITQLNSSLQPEWKFKSTNTESCQRLSNGNLDCISDHPSGFEWCVNAVAVDARGVVYADSEDGNLYAVAQGGTLEQSLFLRVALGAAYTPTSIGPDGRVYTQNDGSVFVITQNPKRRVVRTR